MNFSLLLQEISKLFKSLSASQKVIMTFFGTLMLVALIALSFSEGSNKSYSLLYSGLTPSDASKIITELKSSHVKYKITGKGTIDVPSNKVFAVRMQLASKNLPSEGVVGFELFDKSSFGTTDFLNNINYQRALSGALTRTIDSLNEVKNSRVQIAIPKPSIFVSKQQRPTASVVLSLNYNISMPAVRAIQHIVASSVPGMRTEDVTVVSSDGTLLSKSREMAINDEKIKYQRQIEQLLANKVRNLLAPIVGNKLTVAIKVDADFSKVSKQSVSYDPNSVPISEETTTEKNGTAASGVPGVVSNITSSPSAQSMPILSSKKKTITNFDVGKTVTQNSLEPGRIKRVTASVIVDGSYVMRKNKPIYLKRSNQQMNQIKSLIASAIGYDKSRGDILTVANVQFALPKPPQVKKISTMQRLFNEFSNFLPILRYFFGLIAVMLLYLFVAKPLVKNLSKPIAEISSAGSIDETVVGKKVSDIQAKVKKEIETESQMTEKQIKDKEIKVAVKAKVNDLPEAATTVIRGWMNE